VSVGCRGSEEAAGRGEPAAGAGAPGGQEEWGEAPPARRSSAALCVRVIY
jgi:hypothetical protein